MEPRENPATEQNTVPRRRRPSLLDRNRSRHGRLLAALLAILTVFVLLGGLIAPDRAFSDTENRSLAQFPALSAASLADGGWFAGVTDWFADQFPLRDGWIAVRSGWQRLTGAKEAGNVYFGKDCLLSVPETPDAEAAANTAEAMNAFAGKYPQTPVRLMLVPGAAAVRKEALPDNAPARDQLADVRAFESALTSVAGIDAASALLGHSGEYIYYRTDHHWTSRGAKYAFDAAAPELGLTPPEYEFLPVCGEFRGTLASRSGCASYADTVEICVPQLEDFYYYVETDGEKTCSMFRSEALEKKDKYTVFLGGNHARTDIRTTAESGKTLLLFKDSYANCFVQFLLPCYDRIIMIDPRYYYGEVDSLMTGVTDVLFLYSADTLLTGTSLADVLTAAE